MTSKTKTGLGRLSLLMLAVLAVALVGYVFVLSSQVQGLEATLDEKQESLSGVRTALAKQDALNLALNDLQEDFKINEILRMLKDSPNRHDFPVRSGEFIVGKLDDPTPMITSEKVESVNANATLYVPSGEHRLRITARWLDTAKDSQAAATLIDNEYHGVRRWRSVLDKPIDGDQVYDVAIRFRKVTDDPPKKVARERLDCFLNDEQVATLFDRPAHNKPVTEFHVKKSQHYRYKVLQRPNELYGAWTILPTTKIVGGYYLGPRLSHKSFVYMVWLESTAKPGMRLERILASQQYFDNVFGETPLGELFEEPQSDGYYYFRPDVLKTPEAMHNAQHEP